MIDYKKQHDEDLKNPRWKEKREEVLDFYHYRCMGCGRKVPLQIHHPRYFKHKDGTPFHLWEYRIYQLIPYCAECHAKIHGASPNIIKELTDDFDYLSADDDMMYLHRLIYADRYESFNMQEWSDAQCDIKKFYNKILKDIPDLTAYEFYHYLFQISDGEVSVNIYHLKELGLSLTDYIREKKPKSKTDCDNILQPFGFSDVFFDRGNDQYRRHSSIIDNIEPPY